MLFRVAVLHLNTKKFTIFWVIFTLLIAKLFGFCVPLILKKLVDSVSSVSESSEVLIWPVFFLVLSYGICGLFALIFNEFKEFLSAKLTQKVIASLGIRIFKEIHDLPIQYLIKKQSGVITREIDRGIKGLQLIISVAVHSLIPSTFEFLIVVIYFGFSYDKIFLFALLATLFLYVVFTSIITKSLVKKKNELNDADSNSSQKLVDSLQNAENVKLFGNEAFEIQRFSELSEAHLAAVIKIQRIFTLLSIGQQVIVSFGGCIILWLCILGILKGSMGVGDLVMISALLMQLFLPLSALGILYKDVKQALIDVNNLNQIIGNKISAKSNNPDINLTCDKPLSIEFHNVDFSFNDVVGLSDISFKIDAGQTVAIVGASGSGKSTLIKLISRLYEPNKGSIFIQGNDISKFSANSIRRLIGVVPQDISLFNGSISYNIGYGNINSTSMDIASVVDAVYLKELISKLPHGHSTIVGERGQLLSGGERQRIGIARAILKNPSILVFDEATSALDAETEAAIHNDMVRALRNKTILIITHRLAVISHVDKILVLDKGGLVAEGSHEELLDSCEIYQNMWKMQTI